MTSPLSPAQSLRIAEFLPPSANAAATGPAELAQQLPSVMPPVTAQVVVEGGRVEPVGGDDRNPEPRRHDSRCGTRWTRPPPGKGVLLDQKV